MSLSLALSLFVVFAVVVCFIFKQYIDRLVRSDEMVKVLRKEIGSLILDVNEASDRNIRLIEDRIQLLKNFVLKTDRTIESYKRALHELREVQEKVRHQNKEILAESASENPIPQNPPKSIETQIIELHKQGVRLPVIASSLGIPLGEVELILALSD